jgi:hypothetical protein
MGSPPEKGGKKNKKTLILTLGSPPEKGGKEIKKKPWYYPWAARRKRAKKKNLIIPVGKGRGKKKKNPSINPVQRHLKYTKAGSAIE